MVRIHPDPPVLSGGVAQLGERLLCKQEVIGSIPFTSTIYERRETQRYEERDSCLIRTSERSKASQKAYFWSFDRRGCSLFNNSEEASVLISQDQYMGCDCIQNGSSLVGRSRHKRENSYGRELRSQARPQGYRVKRASAYGGCLGDHRRRRT